MRYCYNPESQGNNVHDESHFMSVVPVAKPHKNDNRYMGIVYRKTFPLSIMQRVILHTPENESQLRGYDMNANDCEVI